MSKVLVFNQYGGPEGQELITRPVPEPGLGEIAVEVRAAGVNPVDWKIREGLLGTDQERPVPMGQEVAGVVTALGEGVEGFTVGQAVLGTIVPGLGGFAEHTLVRADTAVAKPEEISFVDASTIPVAAAAAYDGTHQVDLEKGQSLLILGIGGGVGVMAAQIGKIHEFVVLGTGSKSKRDLVESYGAVLVPYGPDLGARLRAVAPLGVDQILDRVGGDALREVAGLVSDPRNIISAADPDTASELGGSGLQRTPDSLRKITEVVEYGLVDPHVTARYPLEQAGEAVAAVESGHASGKVVIEMGRA